MNNLTDLQRMRARWIGFNGTFLAFLLFATYGENQIAEIITASFIWFMAVMSILFIHPHIIKALYDKGHKPGHVVPDWIDLTYDVIVVAILLKYAWLACAIGYAFHMIMQNWAYKKLKEYIRERES